MPEGADEAVPADDEGVFCWRSAAATRDSPAAGDGKPVAPGRTEARGSAAGSAGEAAGGGQLQVRTTAEVLADRLAAALVQHEPGWRLPRHTVLARRYNVSTAQIDAAISELARRHLVRRLPGGQVHRISPAEYLIPLEGVPGLRSRIDPMAGDLTCRSRRTSWRRVPEDIARALHVDLAERVCAVHAIWAAGDEPAAYATTYRPADMVAAFPGTAAPGAGEAAVGKPAALHVEMRAPSRSIARSLRLSAGQPAAMLTVRFDDPATGRPVALTVALLRPELFRIVVQTEEVPLPGGDEGGLSRARTRTAKGWKS